MTKPHNLAQGAVEVGTLLALALLKEAAKTFIGATCAASLALYSIGMLFEGFAQDRYSGALVYPFVDEPAAARLYDRVKSDARDSARSRAAAALVRADPGSPEGWEAEAYSNWTPGGGLSARGVSALKYSYAVSLFDLRSAVWRVGFALDNWGAITPEVRRQVMTEAHLALSDPLQSMMTKRLDEINTANRQ